jgi:hypothetical protein
MQKPSLAVAPGTSLPRPHQFELSGPASTGGVGGVVVAGLEPEHAASDEAAASQTSGRTSRFPGCFLGALPEETFIRGQY